MRSTAPPDTPRPRSPPRRWPRSSSSSSSSSSRPLGPSSRQQLARPRAVPRTTGGWPGRGTARAAARSYLPPVTVKHYSVRTCRQVTRSQSTCSSGGRATTAPPSSHAHHCHAPVIITQVEKEWYLAICHEYYFQYKERGDELVAEAESKLRFSLKLDTFYLNTNI